jgi:hypothetical protein
MEKRKLYTIIVIILACLAGVTALYFFTKPSPNDDRYYTDKYQNLNDHNACVEEYWEHNSDRKRLTGLPCPGEPQ